MSLFQRAQLPLIMVAAIAAPMLVTTSTSPVKAQSISDMSCSSLWYARNELYYDVGYCFKTKRGKKNFDNDDCSIKSQSKAHRALSSSDRKLVKRIRAREKAKGC